MTTLLNLAENIGKENQITLKVILSNYSMDKLFDTLPKSIYDESNDIEYHMKLEVIPPTTVYEIKYTKKGQEDLMTEHGTDLRQLVINIILKIIDFRIKNKNYKCNNEF